LDLHPTSTFSVMQTLPLASIKYGSTNIERQWLFAYILLFAGFETELRCKLVTYTLTGSMPHTLAFA
jgi:hypothetical protein